MTAPVTDGPRRHPATAHFPLADDGTTCAVCQNFAPIRKPNRGRCLKWAEFMNLAYRYDAEFRKTHRGWWRALPTIDSGTPACQYFVVDSSISGEVVR